MLFNWGVFRVKKVRIPVVSFGNLSVGGTGKTPHVNYLVDALKSSKRIAVLLRGYGRKSKGVIRVTKNAQVETVGDEALLYKKRHQDLVDVVVAEKRVEGAELLMNSSPTPELIILDDAYQHRAIHRDVNILLMDFNNPLWKDAVLPAGNLREFAWQKKRADVIIVTKCPDGISGAGMDEVINKVKPHNKQIILFSQIVYGDFIPFDNSSFGLPEHILLVTGIANAHPLKSHLEKIATVEHLSFPDHYDYKSKDIQKIHDLFDKFARKEKVIVTTEKDYMRLMSSGYSNELKKYPWFYQEITIQLNDEERLIKRILEK